MIHDDLIGKKLANFKIERLIGRGSMAQVYFGYDVKLDRPVAIKVIDVRHRGEPEYAKRFVREAQSVAKWRHDNIVQIYYADDKNGLYYYAMEYLDGQDLAAHMAEHTAKGELMPQAEVLRIGVAFAKALDYAHQHMVIHRDVKPSNLMVTKDGRIVLTDFGLAMDVEQGSIGNVFGTAHYIAPEQARRSADAVAQSDLYSLGVIFYEMLTGRVPFDDPSPTAVAVQHMTVPPPLPREFNPSLNVETETVLLKALSKLPSERYQTGYELVTDLETAFLSSHPVTVSTKPESTKSLIGQKLDEYRLENLLGRGGMGRVYRALDVNLKRTVAIKIIDTPFYANETYKERFQREAVAVARLKHPHIVALYSSREANGVLYIAMEYIEGYVRGRDLHATLASYRQEHQFMPFSEVVRLIGQICVALDYAHSKGVIHRDIKPANIMLDKEGNAVLVDFGLTLLVDQGTRGEVLGSVHYIAPEQVVSSANVVPQSDLYAVGVILYEMLTGQVPFDAPVLMDVALKHLDELPPSPRKLRPDLSAAVEAVVLKALAKKSENRYPTGAALTEALSQALPLTEESAAVPVAQKKKPAQAKAKLPELPPIPVAMAHPSIQSTSVLPSTSTRLLDAVSSLAEVPPSNKRAIYGAGAVVGLLILLGIVFLFMGNDKSKVAEATPAIERTSAVSADLKLPTETIMPTTEIISPTETMTTTIAVTATAVLTATPILSEVQVLTSTISLSATVTPAFADNSLGRLGLWRNVVTGSLASKQEKWYKFNSGKETEVTIIAFIRNGNIEMFVYHSKEIPSWPPKKADTIPQIGKGENQQNIDQNQYTTDLVWKGNLSSEPNTNFYVRLVNRDNRAANYCIVTGDKKSCR